MKAEHNLRHRSVSSIQSDYPCDCDETVYGVVFNQWDHEEYFGK